MFFFICLALNKYINILETRLSKVASVQQVAGNVAKKARVLGEPSRSNPPHDAPTWAVKRDCITEEAEGMS